MLDFRFHGYVTAVTDSGRVNDFSRILQVKKDKFELHSSFPHGCGPCRHHNQAAREL